MNRGLVTTRLLVLFIFACGATTEAQPPVSGSGNPPPPQTGTAAEPTVTQEVPENQEEDPGEEFSLEELMDIEVTSVSKKAQKLSGSAAAIFVVTQEDIQRIGAEAIADALRIVPGLHVAHIARGRWSVSSRTFSGEFANDLLTQMDGRTLYNSLFSGTYWDSADTILEDIDRIEVIRGPGATLWGANAVNGIISVITKPADETQGFLLKSGWSTNDNMPWAQFRYGGEISEDAHFRIYGKWFDRDGGLFANGDDFHDDWDAWKAGFRLDWNPSPDDTLTFWGDTHWGHSEEQTLFVSLAAPYLVPREQTARYGGYYVQGRWNHRFSDTSDMTLQLYYDNITRKQDLLNQDLNVFDVDFEHRFELGDRHELIWGVGYRVYWDDLDNSMDIGFFPDHRTAQTLSAFIQDTITVIPDELSITVGSKFEHNDFSGFELQPNLRAVWTPDDRNTIWGAISHAVRTPSRVEHDALVIPTVMPPSGPMMPLILGSFGGDSSFKSEEVTAFEVGYRVRPTDNLSFDLAVFYNDYDDLLTSELGALTPGGAPGVLLLPAVFDNKADGETYGFELASQWQVLDNWRLSASYSLSTTHIHALGSSTDPVAEVAEDQYPRHQFNVRSYLDVADNLQFNTVLYYVDNLGDLGIHNYLRWDAQVTWQPADFVNVTLGVQNILDDRHPEFMPVLNRPASETERRGYVSVEFRF